MMSVSSTPIDLSISNVPTSVQDSERELRLNLEGQGQVQDNGIGDNPIVSRTRALFIVFFLSGVTFLSSMGAGKFSRLSNSRSYLNLIQVF